ATLILHALQALSFLGSNRERLETREALNNPPGWQVRSSSGGDFGQLPFGQSFSERTLRSDRPYFHDHAIGQTRAVFGDRDSLIEAFDLQQQVTAKRVF